MTDTKAEAIARRLDGLVITLLVFAEAEVVAYDDVADAEPLVQKLFDHPFRRGVTHGLVERHAQHPIELGPTQERDFLPESSESGRNLFTGEVFPWLRLEGQQHAGHTQFLRLGKQVDKQHPMAVMDAVEVAEGEDAALVFGLQAVDAVNNLHEAIIRPKPGAGGGRYAHPAPRR